MRNKVINIIDHLSNIKWDIVFYIKFLVDKNFRTILLRNKDLKGRHIGKRCFIVGNGPSLKKMDLSRLRDEITITVNNIMNNQEIYNAVYADYHVFIDPMYSSLESSKPQGADTIELLKSINYPDKQPACLVSYEGLSSYKKNGLVNHLNLYYLYQHRNMLNRYSHSIDLTKNIPSSQNVTQAAIFSAIYMGFKEIYLIGCDMTSVFLTFETNEDGERAISKSFHAYQYNINEEKTMLKNANKHDNEYMLYDYAKTFTIFKRIRKYAEKNDIKIFNATIGGGLDVFERVKYSSLF